MAPKPTVFAIDFGTSNSLLAAASSESIFDPAPLDDEAADPTILRSALYFQRLDAGEFGVRAVRALVENGFQGRLIRSIKRHLPSRTFTATRIGSRYATLEDLIGAFLKRMRERASKHYGADVRRAVMGRPARFSNDPEDDRLAEERLGRAAAVGGFEDVTFCPEPVAAAYELADDLDQPRVVLVADLGGGTSDFTVVRMRRDGFDPDDVLAVGGVAVAGDAIDGALVRSVVAPHFGSGARYRVPFGANDLDMPLALVELLSSPADLTVIDRGQVLRQLESIRAGLVDEGDRDKLDRFVALVEDGLGFPLYEAVEAAKRRLSDVSSTLIDVGDPSIALRERVSRSELERSATRQVQAIVSSLERTLDVAGIAANDVEIACLTGGTSRMPLVAAAIEASLPRASLRRLESFHSVVVGLARRAREEARAG
jgi:hypothetical chaperone protein